MPYGNNSASPNDPAPRTLHKINYWVEQIANGGSGGDASAANQTLQITEAEETNTTLTTISGKLPATLGQKAMAASLAVTIASNQSDIPVTVSGGATSANQVLQIAEAEDTNIKLDSLSTLQFGMNGGEVATDDTISSGPYYAFKALTDTTIVVATLMSPYWTGGSNLDGLTIYAGDVVIIGFSSLEFTGTIIAYKA